MITILGNITKSVSILDPEGLTIKSYGDIEEGGLIILLELEKT